MKFLIVLTPLAFVSNVLAHTIFQELYVNGVSQGHQVGIRVPDYDGVSLQSIPEYNTLTIYLAANHGRDLERYYLQWWN